jgi:hypothetical protein
MYCIAIVVMTKAKDDTTVVKTMSVRNKREKVQWAVDHFVLVLNRQLVPLLYCACNGFCLSRFLHFEFHSR